MAVQDNLRDTVSDPLAFNPARRGADRSLPTYGVRNPGQTGGNSYLKQATGALGIIDSIQATLGQIASSNMETSFTEGKLAFMAGATEADIAAKGDKYYAQGWQALKAASDGNSFLQSEAQFIENEGRAMDPASYQKRLMDYQAQAIKALPNDPAVRKTWAAQFQDYGPRLAAAQAKAHNDYNEQQSIAGLQEYLLTGAPVQADATRPVMGGQLRISDSVVSDPVKYDATDLDVLTRTLIGEAGGEGPAGMAAVASVIVNRTRDGRYPKKVSDVALQDKQFSAWNQGEGGNNPSKWSPDSPIYQKAQQIAMAVLDGHVVDQTGGATHYYAPKGMKDGKAPDWWDQEVARSGGAVQIGSQIFAGKASAVERSDLKGILDFAHPDQTDIDSSFADILKSSANAVGGKLRITSGKRDPNHPVEAAKGNGGGEHTHGTAADIDMTGMSEMDKMNLVRDLRSRGVKRFGTYDNEPNMLHVDMKDQTGDGKSNWFMHNKSNKNLAAAPAWFRQVAGEPIQDATDKAIPDGVTSGQAAGAMGVPVDQNGAASAQATRIQQFIRSAPGKREVKAAALVSAITTAFVRGDDTVFNDAGGMGALVQLGATPEQVARVQKAQKAFEEEQDKKYDATVEKQRANLLARSANGDFATTDDAIAEVEKMYKDGLISDSEAKSLSRQVAADQQKADNSIIPIAARDEYAKLFVGINDGRLDQSEAGQQAVEIGKRYGLKASVINNYVASMYSKAEQRREELKTKIQEEAKKQAKEQIIKTTVDHALVTGTGLKGLTGTIRRNNPETGIQEEVSAVQFGIDKLKADVQQRISEDVQSGRISKEAAGPMATAEVYENLAKQGVHDTKFGQAMASAVTGEVVGKDGKVADSALRGLDQYMQMANNPNIGTAYMKGMIGDDAAITFYETARQQYAADLDMSGAIRRASQILSAPMTPELSIERSQSFTRKVGSAATDILNNITNDVSFWGLFTNEKSAYSVSSIQDLAGTSRDLMKTYLQQRADTYHARNNREPVDVSLAKAKADMQNNAVVIGDTLVMGEFSQGERLDQKMFGRENQFTIHDPQRALNWKLEQVAPKEWGALWADRMGGKGVFDTRSRRPGQGLATPSGPNLPPYTVQYDPKQGVLMVSLYKDDSRTETVGKPLVFDASRLGAEYASTLSRGEATVLTDTARSVKEGMAEGLKAARANPQNAVRALLGDGVSTQPDNNPGAAIGRMFNPGQ